MNLNSLQWHQAWKRTRHNWQIGAFSNLFVTAIQNLIWSLYITHTQVTLKSLHSRQEWANARPWHGGRHSYLNPIFLIVFSLYDCSLFWQLWECSAEKYHSRVQFHPIISPLHSEVPICRYCKLAFLCESRQIVLMYSKWEITVIFLT